MSELSAAQGELILGIYVAPLHTTSKQYCGTVCDNSFDVELGGEVANLSSSSATTMYGMLPTLADCRLLMSTAHCICLPLLAATLHIMRATSDRECNGCLPLS